MEGDVEAERASDVADLSERELFERFDDDNELVRRRAYEELNKRLQASGRSIRDFIHNCHQADLVAWYEQLFADYIVVDDARWDWYLKWNALDNSTRAAEDQVASDQIASLRAQVEKLMADRQDEAEPVAETPAPTPPPVSPYSPEILRHFVKGQMIRAVIFFCEFMAGTVTLIAGSASLPWWVLGPVGLLTLWGLFAVGAFLSEHWFRFELRQYAKDWRGHLLPGLFGIGIGCTISIAVLIDHRFMTYVEESWWVAPGAWSVAVFVGRLLISFFYAIVVAFIVVTVAGLKVPAFRKEKNSHYLGAVTFSCFMFALPAAFYSWHYASHALAAPTFAYGVKIGLAAIGCAVVPLVLGIAAWDGISKIINAPEEVEPTTTAFTPKPAGFGWVILHIWPQRMEPEPGPVIEYQTNTWRQEEESPVNRPFSPRTETPRPREEQFKREEPFKAPKQPKPPKPPRQKRQWNFSFIGRAASAGIGTVNAGWNSVGAFGRHLLALGRHTQREAALTDAGRCMATIGTIYMGMLLYFNMDVELHGFPADQRRYYWYAAFAAMGVMFIAFLRFRRKAKGPYDYRLLVKAVSQLLFGAALIAGSLFISDKLYATTGFNIHKWADYTTLIALWLIAVASTKLIILPWIPRFWRRR